MSTLTVTIKRSDKWVRDQAIARGENVPADLEVKCEVGELSVGVREQLYRGFGKFPHEWRGTYNSKFQPSENGWFGQAPIFLDSDAPTPTELDAAIAAGFAEIEARRAKAEQEAAERRDREQATANEWASLPLEARSSASGVCYCRGDDGKLYTSGVVAYPSDILQRLAPDAWAEARERSKLLGEIENGKKAAADRQVLSEFLAEIPNDALRGTLKRLACGDEAVEALREKIEAASPKTTIFGDDDEE